MSRSDLRDRLYTAAQWTWGIPQTLVGAGLYLMHRGDKHFDYKGARVTAWDRDQGVSLGKFVFVPRGYSHGRTKSVHVDPKTGAKVDRFLLEHEYGHSLQSLILGPAYLVLVGAPSLLWSRAPVFDRVRRKTGKSYYSAIFERTANELGSRTGDRNDNAATTD